MKKTLITIFVAFFIGGILATLTIFKFEKNLKINPLNENYITAFQVGIYKNLANAEVVAKE